MTTENENNNNKEESQNKITYKEIYKLLTKPTPDTLKLLKERPITTESELYAAVLATDVEAFDTERLVYVMRMIDIQEDNIEMKQIQKWQKELYA